MAEHGSTPQYDDRTPGNIRESHESRMYSTSTSPASCSRSTRWTSHHSRHQQTQRRPGKRRRIFDFLTGGIFSSSRGRRSHSREIMAEDDSRGRRAEQQPRRLGRETTHYRASWIDDEGRVSSSAMRPAAVRLTDTGQRVRHPQRQCSPAPPTDRQMRPSRRPRTATSPVADWPREDRPDTRQSRTTSRPNIYRSPTYESVPDDEHEDVQVEAAPEIPLTTRQSPERYGPYEMRETSHHTYRTRRPEEDDLSTRAPQSRGRVPPPAPELFDRREYEDDFTQNRTSLEYGGDISRNQNYMARHNLPDFQRYARHSSEPAGLRNQRRHPNYHDGQTSRSPRHDVGFDDDVFFDPRDGRTRPHSEYYTTRNHRTRVPDDITRHQQADTLYPRDHAKSRRSLRRSADSAIEIPFNYGHGGWESRHDGPVFVRRRPRSMNEGGTTHHGHRRRAGAERRVRGNVDESDCSSDDHTDFESSADSVTQNYERPRNSRR